MSTLFNGMGLTSGPTDPENPSQWYLSSCDWGWGAETRSLCGLPPSSLQRSAGKIRRSRSWQWGRHSMGLYGCCMGLLYGATPPALCHDATYSAVTSLTRHCSASRFLSCGSHLAASLHMTMLSVTKKVLLSLLEACAYLWEDKKRQRRNSNTFPHTHSLSISQHSVSPCSLKSTSPLQNRDLEIIPYYMSNRGGCIRAALAAFAGHSAKLAAYTCSQMVPQLRTEIPFLDQVLWGAVGGCRVPGVLLAHVPCLQLPLGIGTWGVSPYFIKKEIQLKCKTHTGLPLSIVALLLTIST